MTKKTSPDIAEILSREILPLVEKPSRYLGNEHNAVIKDPGEVEIRLALAFPDLYDLGLGNLGIHILYACLNKLPWAYCERLYAPGLDMEAALRSRNLPLFVLETKDPASCMDGIGFTLQSELTYTNILNMINLAGLELRAEDRKDGDPLLFAGGPAVFNPEPIAPFMDFFVIGDGEDVVMEIAEVLRREKGNGKLPTLEALSRLKGVYVPSLYPFEVMENGAILPDPSAPKIVKRTVKDLDGATFPTDYIVPFTQQVHDRVSLEVLRGCTQGCRFCQAGMTTRPVRERSLEKVDELMERTLNNTGYEEVSLVSLSTCDYSRVQQLVENTVKRAKPQHVSVSLPSLRLDSFSVELADMVAETRRTGLTVAPEAASPRLRAVINKWIPDEELLDMTRGAYKLGWKHVKLYFMIGLPTERDDDIEAIADLSLRTVQQGKEINPRAAVNLGVSTFVPKPFTPFQWAEQISLEETSRRQDILERCLNRNSRIKFGRHDPEETFLEGLVSRSDRRAADLLEAAYLKGCRFDAWGEHLRFDLWQEAIEETGFDVADAFRERDIHERLPWDHIDIHVDKQWLIDDWARAQVLKYAEDCRHRKCHQCGVIDKQRELCATMLRDHVKGRREEAKWERKPRAPEEPKVAVQRLWFKVSRTGAARFLAHLEAMNAWLRALRRGKAPLAYSAGFHPHPKVAFSSAMPQNEESEGEYMDVLLESRVDPDILFQSLVACLPEGFGVHSVKEVPLKAPSLMSLAHGARYRFAFSDTDPDALKSHIDGMMEQGEIWVDRKVKGRRVKGRKGRLPTGNRTKPYNIRPSIKHLSVRSDQDAPGVLVDVTLVNVEGKRARPRELVKVLYSGAGQALVTKEETLTTLDSGYAPISQTW